MTNKEIIRALECLCGFALKCRECPYSPRYQFPLCQQRVAKDALDLINRQQAEIEKLKKELQITRDAYTMLQTKNEIDKSEAVKEFAERLKENKFTHRNLGQLVYVEDIDNLVKEMVGDDNA